MIGKTFDFTKLVLLTRYYTKKLWVRVVLMGLMAFFALGITQLIELVVPRRIGSELTGAAADRLLQIIADAMLAVTIFSITVMVSVYRASSQQWTPRIHRLIIEDPTTQNTLAVFIGAYVYALLAIILRELGIYVDDRALVLFGMTVVVLAVIVIYLIRWVLHLQTLGSMVNVTRQIERVTIKRFTERRDTPCLGARPLSKDVPGDAVAIKAAESGYVKTVFVEELNEIARIHGVHLYLVADLGSFVFANAPLVMARRVSEPKEDKYDWDSLEACVRRNVVQGDLRTYDQDPRFGLIVLGEVASKALSPGVNDPGTAIDVITRIGRVLSCFHSETKGDDAPALEYLYLRPLSAEDVVEDAFGALARDGCAVLGVQQRLQKALAGLLNHPDENLRRAVKEAAARHLQRSVEAIPFKPDRDALIAMTHPAVRAEAGIDG